jgi:heme/copper-type cytochrome/quinol oxidase subunit 2
MTRLPKNKKRIYLILTILFPIISFFLIVGLYNIWFDTWDKIKYDPTYSPEFDQNKTIENIIYWGVIIICAILEIILIKKHRQQTVSS